MMSSASTSCWYLRNRKNGRTTQLGLILQAAWETPMKTDPLPNWCLTDREVLETYRWLNLSAPWSIPLRWSLLLRAWQPVTALILIGILGLGMRADVSFASRSGS